jgi:hypothetical protein
MVINKMQHIQIVTTSSSRVNKNMPLSVLQDVFREVREREDADHRSAWLSGLRLYTRDFARIMLFCDTCLVGRSRDS